jgi:tRNA threonylcarbamoyladenosine biosynthesis protein TsaB
MLLLGIDTCGPSGSVALGRLMNGASVQILAQEELAGRSYTATLIAAVEDLLKRQNLRLREVGCIVVVHGPGSFTGVRVGLSAAKGLAEGAGIPMVAVSRLEVLARKAGTPGAALDAHRHEVFLRIAVAGGPFRELLAGAPELSAIAPTSPIAVCDEAAAQILRTAWPAAQLIQTDPPSAADALALAAPRIVSGDYDDVALLDGNYLRRSDAEIFGTTPAAAKSS